MIQGNFARIELKHNCTPLGELTLWKTPEPPAPLSWSGSLLPTHGRIVALEGMTGLTATYEDYILRDVHPHFRNHDLDIKIPLTSPGRLDLTPVYFAFGKGEQISGAWVRCRQDTIDGEPTLVVRPMTLSAPS